MTTKKQALSAIQDAATAIDRQYPTPCVRRPGGRLLVPVAEFTPAIAALIADAGLPVRTLGGREFAIVPGV